MSGRYSNLLYKFASSWVGFALLVSYQAWAADPSFSNFSTSHNSIRSYTSRYAGAVIFDEIVDGSVAVEASHSWSSVTPVSVFLLASSTDNAGMDCADGLIGGSVSGCFVSKTSKKLSGLEDQNILIELLVSVQEIGQVYVSDFNGAPSIQAGPGTTVFMNLINGGVW